MNKEFLIKTVFFTTGLFCFLLSAEQKSPVSGLDKTVAVDSKAEAQPKQKDSASVADKIVAVDSKAEAQPKQKNSASVADKTVAVDLKPKAQPKQKEQQVHSSATQKGSDKNPLLSISAETVGKAQGKQETRNLQADNLYNQRFLELGLEYPLNFGIHLRYLIGSGIYARFGLSFMPGFFLDSFEKLSPSFGYLNEEEAKLISDTFENSMYLDFRLAWAPYLQKSVSGGGPYLELGLSGIFYGKGELEGLSLSKAIKGSSFEELKTYSVKTNAYNATVHAGYQVPFEKVKLNIEVGLIKILDADTLSVTTTNAPELLSAEQKQEFRNFLKKKGWIFPTVSGWLSFSF